MLQARILKDPAPYTKNKVCFYTGLKMTNGSQHNPRKRTIEHIIPKSAIPDSVKRNQSMYCMIRKCNEVRCCSLINKLVDTAPLKVKFALKQHIQKIIDNSSILFISDKEDKLIYIYAEMTKTFLDKYKVKGVYFWKWKEAKSNQKEHVRRHYLTLLTKEEIKAGLYIK